MSMVYTTQAHTWAVVTDGSCTCGLEEEMYIDTV